MSGEKDPADLAARRERLRKKYAAALEQPGLSRPGLQREPLALPAGTTRYPVLQELAAVRQEVKDEFSKSQLGLIEVKAKLESDISVLSGSSDKRPEAAPPAARQKDEAAPAAAPPAAPRAAYIPPVLEPAAEEPEGRGWSGPWTPRAIAAAVLCSAVFLFFGLFSGGGGKTSYSLPPSAAAGLCLDGPGARVFFTDPRRQLLIAVSVAGKRVETMQSFQAQGLKGLAFDGNSFWTTDGTEIVRHGTAPGYPGESAYKAGPGVFSLSWDGSNLWAASAGGRLVRYAAGDKPAPEAVYQLPDGFGTWAAVAGGKIWELDAETGRLAAYTLAVKPELLARADVRKDLPRGEIAGFAVGGGGAWVVTADPAELVRLDLKRLKLQEK